jgi:hypothetical protein
MTKARSGSRQRDDQVERFTLIRRALLGLDYWLSGAAFLLPFCDYLKILLHKPDPLIVTLWNNANPPCQVFSTHPEAATQFAGNVAAEIPHADRFVACYNRRGEAFHGDVEAHVALSDLFAHPDFTISREGKLFGKSLKDASPMPIQRQQDRLDGVAPKDTKAQSACDVSFSDMFKGVRGILERSGHFQLETGQTDGPINLFPFLFVADAIRGTMGSKVTYQPVPATESARPFLSICGQGTRAAFHAGTIIFESPSKTQKPPEAGAEPAVMALASRDRIYIPIHIEGSPWIVLLRFLSNSPPSDWNDVYHFYHDVIPRIGAMLRSEVKATYLDFVETFFAGEIGNPDLPSFVTRFNDKSATLLRSFPFPHVYLNDNPSSGEPLLLPNGRHVTVGTEPNRYFQTEWTYDPLGTLATDACERAIRAFAREERRIRSRFLGHRHSMVNLNPGPLLDAAVIQGEDQLSGDAKTFVADAARTSDLLFAVLDFVATETRTHPPLRNKSIGGILRWLKEKEISGVAQATLQIADAADFRPAPETMEDIFLVLWNLWHNAARMAGTRFEVTLSEDKLFRLVTFSQETAWPMEDLQWIEFLNGQAQSPNKEREPSGLEIVRQSLYHLKWGIAATAMPAVRIEIRIPPVS